MVRGVIRGRQGLSVAEREKSSGTGEREVREQWTGLGRTIDWLLAAARACVVGRPRADTPMRLRMHLVSSGLISVW